MKHKWLAVALTCLAALGAVTVASTVHGVERVAALAVGLVTLATLAFVRQPRWPWFVIGAAALTAVAALLVQGVGVYLVASAFLAAVAGVFDLAAPRKDPL